MSGLFDDVLVANGMEPYSQDLDVPEQEPLGGVHFAIVEAYRTERGGYTKAATVRWGIPDVSQRKGWKRDWTSATRHSKENVLRRLTESAEIQFTVSTMIDGRMRVGAAELSHSWVLAKLEEHGYERVRQQGFHGLQFIEVFRKRED